MGMVMLPRKGFKCKHISRWKGEKKEEITRHTRTDTQAPGQAPIAFSDNGQHGLGYKVIVQLTSMLTLVVAS